METIDKPTLRGNVYDPACPTRLILDRIADKWTVLIVGALAGGTKRFGELRRQVGGITQKVLTESLRGLERDGLLTRRVYASVPPRVEYTLTRLGRSLIGLVESIRIWAEGNIEEVTAAQEEYDRLLASASIPASSSLRDGEGSRSAGAAS